MHRRILFYMHRRHVPSLYNARVPVFSTERNIPLSLYIYMYIHNREECLSSVCIGGISSIRIGGMLLSLYNERVSVFSIERRQPPHRYRRERVSLLDEEEAYSIYSQTARVYKEEGHSPLLYREYRQSLFCIEKGSVSSTWLYFLYIDEESSRGGNLRLYTNERVSLLSVGDAYSAQRRSCLSLL